MMNRIFFYCMRKVISIFEITEYMQNLSLLRSLSDRNWEDRSYYESTLGLKVGKKSKTSLLFTNKINLFQKLVDYEDTGMIKKNSLLEIIRISFLQDVLGNFDIESIINKIYNDDQEISIYAMEGIFDKDEKLGLMADVLLS